LSTIRVCW